MREVVPVAERGPRERHWVSRCPACEAPLRVSRLECPQCATAVEGRFELTPLARLDREQQRFVELFLVSRGNIREVERVLGLSYPTVRNRLEQVIEALGYSVRAEGREGRMQPEERRQLLEALSQGELSVDEVLQRLRSGKE